jgi:hypothetical protein
VTGASVSSIWIAHSTQQDQCEVCLTQGPLSAVGFGSSYGRRIVILRVHAISSRGPFSTDARSWE